jgi:SAM-dependent methyltransferase
MIGLAAFAALQIEGPPAMHLDVLDLRDFYYRSPLGRAAQTVIRDQLVDMWPNAKGMTVAGYGFAVPLLRPFLGEARRVIGLMPAPQGVMPWPAGQPNVSVLCDDTLWPIATGALDRLVVLHGLESSDHPGALLDECYRALGPGGRAVFIVPNRSGIWSRTDRTPFGYGRPYSMSQLEAQLRDHAFVVERALSTLYQPPSTHKMWRRIAPLMERAGRYLPIFAAGGVLMVEASKQVPAPRKRGTAARVSRPLQVLEGLGVPEPTPAGRQQTD